MYLYFSTFSLAATNESAAAWDRGREGEEKNKKKPPCYKVLIRPEQEDSTNHSSKDTFTAGQVSYLSIHCSPSHLTKQRGRTRISSLLSQLMCDNMEEIC